MLVIFNDILIVTVDFQFRKEVWLKVEATNQLVNNNYVLFLGKHAVYRYCFFSLFWSTEATLQNLFLLQFLKPGKILNQNMEERSWYLKRLD